MFESITMNFLTQPKVVAAVDIFRALQTAATSLFGLFGQTPQGL